MTGHKERGHAFLSASGAHRWLACPPSAMLEASFPDATSEAAREGTLAHELAEAKARNYFYTTEFGKRRLTAAIKKMKENELWHDEMLRYTEAYLDYIREIALAMPSAPYVAVEKRVDLGAYIPEGFGTADCILISGETIHIVDFKYGKGVPVDAESNPQMMLYALGAHEAYRMLYPIKTVALSIVQPRIREEASTWGLPLEDLLKFGDYVKERAALAMEGEGEFAPSEETCRFCRARRQCRARAEENTRLAFLTEKKPPLLGNGEIGRYLAQGEDVAGWLKDLREYALKECLSGRDVPGWKAVEGRGVREWADMDKAFEQLTDGGIEEAILWERTPLSLAQIEKMMGKKEFEACVGGLVVKRAGKPALVKASDKRPAITSQVSAAEAFKEEAE